jgi:hypothetical protein
LKPRALLRGLLGVALLWLLMSVALSVPGALMPSNIWALLCQLPQVVANAPLGLLCGMACWSILAFVAGYHLRP